MKVAVIGDLHGMTPEVNAEALLAVGDFCNTDEYRKLAFEGKKRGIPWYRLVGTERAREILEEAVKSGRRALEHLNSLGVPVYVVAGNADFWSRRSEWSYLRKNHFKRMIKGLKNVKDINLKRVKVGEHWVVGLRYHRLESERKIASVFWRLKKKFRSPGVILSHNAPFGTEMDIVREGPASGKHVGSRILRKAIEELKPELVFFGHLHENTGTFKLGSTTCINPGLGRIHIIEL